MKRRLKALYTPSNREDLMTFYRQKVKELQLAEFEKEFSSNNMDELAFLICLKNTPTHRAG